MEEIGRLSEAFQSFTAASRSLETCYERLNDKVRYLTVEVEQKNRQLERALSETEEAKDLLDGILESMREAIVVLDSSQRVILINRAAEEMLGTGRQEAWGRL